MNSSLKDLDHRMEKNDSLVCVGLDPDPSKMPDEIMNLKEMELEEKVLIFLKTIVDLSADNICAYKVQKAFFDVFDNGHKLLQDIVEYIHVEYPGVPVFIDCKIGDTGNTMKSYMHNLFDIINADGVVVNPLMGDDVLEPFIEDENKVGIVLVQTSNPKAKIVQELKLANGKELWQEILDLTLERWNLNNNLIVVLSSNSSDTNFSEVRQKIPQQTPILLAGVGSQGGDSSVLKDLLNEEKRGVFVNSSRGILYPYAKDDLNWRQKVKMSLFKLKNELNQIRIN